MPSARDQLERQYHEMRWRILSLAADFDRLERFDDGPALVDADPRVARLRECLRIALSNEPDRAERVQILLSDRTPVGPA